MVWVWVGVEVEVGDWGGGRVHVGMTSGGLCEAVLFGWKLVDGGKRRGLSTAAF